MRRALAIVLIALAGAMAAVQAGEPLPKWSVGAPPMNGMTPGLLRAAEESVFFLRFPGELGLTESQAAALREIAYEFQKQRLQKVADMNVAEAELEQLLTREAVDMDAVRRKVGESAAIAAAAKSLQIEALLRAVRVLTHEQHLTVLTSPSQGGPSPKAP